jgi:ABC-type microcin C transport system permease subunit YejB
LLAVWFFIARRVLYAIPILLGVSLVVFLLLKMVPGDAADIMIPPEAPKEVAAMIRARRANVGPDLMVLVDRFADGDYDHVAEQAFFMCGGLDDVERKWDEIQKSL